MLMILSCIPSFLFEFSRLAAVVFDLGKRSSSSLAWPPWPPPHTRQFPSLIKFDD